jgi:ELWxxDGT repeat protein
MGNSSSRDFQCGLWVTDGAPGSAERLAEFCATAEEPGNRLRMLAATGAVAFFSDDYGKLWRTDSTAAGTFPLGDLDAGEIVVGPDGQTVFFGGCTTDSTCGLWRSDGSREGTFRVSGLDPESGSRGAGRFRLQGGRLLFLSGSKKSAAGSLWATDGTAAGTVRLLTAGGDIGQILPHGGAVYLTVDTGDRDEVWVVPAGAKAFRVASFPSGFRIGLGIYEAGNRVVLAPFNHDEVLGFWATDGTRAGIRSLLPKGVGFWDVPNEFATLGRRTLFWAEADTPHGSSGDWHLWYLDDGMKRVRQLNGCPQGCPALGVDSPTAFVPFQGRLFFGGWDPAHGRELWQTDGTAAGTRRVKDLCPGPCDGDPRYLGVELGRLLFRSPSGLWASDGTEAGTLRVAALAPISSYSRPLDLARLGSRVVFTGLDPVNGPQPWVSDLTPGGSQLIDRIGDGLAASGRIAGLTALGGKVLFTGCDGSESAVWASDGTAAGTVLLPGTQEPCPDHPAVSAVSFIPVGGLAFFTLPATDGGKLWRTDGTPAGTVDLLDLHSSAVVDAAPVRGKLLFRLVPGSSQPAAPVWDLWTSDGTPQGTQPAFQLPLGDESFRFTPAGDGLLFSARDPDPPAANSLWFTDGTEAGSRRLHTLGAQGWIQQAVRLGSKTFFIAWNTRGQESEIWMTDGTAAGTAPVIPDANAPHPYFPHALTAFKGALYFFAESRDPLHRGLWRSDGTAAGTRLLWEISAPLTNSAYFAYFDPQLTAAGGQLFFRSDDPVHGTELWKTDGTLEGTALVADIAPGRAPSRLAGLTAAGGKLYFAATDGEHGRELWESDGTAAGTRMVADLLPGPPSAGPEQITAADGKLFFTATDGEHGRELWVLPLP